MEGIGFIGFRVLPPHSNSWIIFRIWLYIALIRTPTNDSRIGAVPRV